MEPATPVFVPAPRLRRAAAFLSDLVILWVAGVLIGLLFFNTVARWGPYGRVVGLVLMTGYLGAGASVMMAGRSLGKRLCGLEVRRVGGGHLAMAPAIGRATMISVPYLANGWTPPQTLQSTLAAFTLTLIVFGLGGSMLYLFFFNRRTGQSVHDLAFSTVVVVAGGVTPTEASPLSARHRIVLSSMAILVIGAFAGGAMLQKVLEARLAPHQALWAALNADPRFFSVGVNHNTFFGGQQPTTTVAIQVWLKDPRADRQSITRELAAITLDHYRAAEPDSLVISLTRAYDLGVASWRLTDFDDGSIADWKARTAGFDIRSQPRPGILSR